MWSDLLMKVSIPVIVKLLLLEQVWIFLSYFPIPLYRFLSNLILLSDLKIFGIIFTNMVLCPRSIIVKVFYGEKDAAMSNLRPALANSKESGHSYLFAALFRFLHWIRKWVGRMFCLKFVVFHLYWDVPCFFYNSLKYIGRLFQIVLRRNINKRITKLFLSKWSAIHAYKYKYTSDTARTFTRNKYSSEFSKIGHEATRNWLL